MLTVDEALSQIRRRILPISVEEVPLTAALGRVLAVNARAETTHPPVAVSAMDGYAVRSEDCRTAPVTLRMIGTSAAGHPFAGTVGKGECARIFTGAALPNGADAIVIQEDTDAAADKITMKEMAPTGDWVRPAGLDFKAGDALLKAGRRLSARDLGLAAAMGLTWLQVRRKPRVAVLSTGDEVVMPGKPRRADQIVSSNSVALLAFAQVLGADAVSLGVAADTPDDLRAKLADARGFDFLVTSGGASVGDHDLIQSVFGAEGLDLGFYKIAMQPGKPLIFGAIGGTWLLGLPGNPVSTGVTAAIFLKAAIEAMLSIEPGPMYRAALLGGDLPANGKRQNYLRASLVFPPDGLPVASAYTRQDSSMLALFADADCLIMRPIGAPAAAAGDIVQVVPLRFAAETF